MIIFYDFNIRAIHHRPDDESDAINHDFDFPIYDPSDYSFLIHENSTLYPHFAVRFNMEGNHLDLVVFVQKFLDIFDFLFFDYCRFSHPVDEIHHPIRHPNRGLFVLGDLNENI